MDCSDGAETCPGPKPFSEPESEEAKELLDEFNPDIFLTVHSGTKGLYTPYAYSTEEAPVGEQEMLDVLTKIDGKYCDCPKGAAGKEVGYLCPGTCLDYAYVSTRVPYVFAWEIYKQDHPSPAYSSFLQTSNPE
jgi:hypothetical protein